MDHEMCLTWYFVGAKGLGDAILHRKWEAFVQFKKVAKMSDFDHKSPSHCQHHSRKKLKIAPHIII